MLVDHTGKIVFPKPSRDDARRAELGGSSRGCMIFLFLTLGSPRFNNT